MKKFKIALGVIIVGFFAIIFFSNKDYFMAKQGLKIDLLVGDPYHLKDLPNAFYFLIFFLVGFLIAYFTSLFDRFKSKKKIKTLNTAATDQLKEISALKKEMESLKGPGYGYSKPPEEQDAMSTA
ncbi:MAG: LapA family protein [Deltaproteobacteria bacterium]|nr:LapA family protein [Deltaproteobacteria bacterium]MBW1825782.1 LapA family protein [Deltaproteobacteria bacterium]MBW2155821.1 LapA family protein [Deltaproteobacteria bacterium]MBW2196541.1 LapA family protein [Deltaproteobacteria bacterium]MBW2225868.1 LapA family protein [Deltaproteobacteria bacterium]